MKHLSKHIGVTLLMAAALAPLSGCFQKPESIRIDGSSTVYPISAKVKDMFVLANGGARINVSKTGTSGGITSFSRGEIDICDASRPMRESEQKLCREAGIEFTEFVVAYDGISLVVNKENDWCRCLSVAQLKELWRSGSPIKKWSDLDPSWPEHEVRLFGPDENSGTFQYFNEEVLGDDDSARADYFPSAEDNALVRGVQADKYALGYFGFAYYVENAETLNVVGVDAGDGCVAPAMDTIMSNAYKPLSRPLMIYVSHASLQRPDVARFVEFYLKEVGRLAEEVGYAPTPDDVAEANLQSLNSIRSPAADADAPSE